MKSSLKKIGNIAYYTFIILLALSIFISIGSRVYSEKTGQKPTIFGYTPTIVVSGSMLPTLQIYSVNIIKNCDTSDVDNRDIIVYWSDELRLNVIHRVIDVEFVDGVKTLTTRGDANRSADDIKTTDENMVGKVVYTMNWLAPYMSNIMNNYGYSINYAKLFEYGLLLTVLIWGTMSILYYVIYIIITLMKHLITKNSTKDGIISDNSDTSCLNDNHIDIKDVDNN